MIAKVALDTEELTAEANKVIATGGEALQLSSNANDMIEEVRIYNIAGALVHQSTNVNNTTFRWENNAAQSLYLIEVKTASHTSNHKVILK